MIALLPGSSAELRAAASHLRATTADLDTARRAAVRIEAVADGEHWRGEAFDAFRAATEQRPVPAALERAKGHMEEAAGRLEHLAARFDENQQTLRWCRSRLAALDPTDPEAAAERSAIERDAEAAWSDHRAGLAAVGDLLDVLDDRPFYAEPPPSTLERVAGGAGSLLLGVGEGLVELGQALVMVSQLLDPATWVGMWHDRDQLLAVLEYAWENPAEFASVLVESMLDLDMLMEDPARWLGRRIPDMLLVLATGGLGRVGMAAARSARTLRGGVAGRAVTGHLGTRLEPRTFGSAVAALGADGSRVARAGGAYARTDTSLGRLALRMDERFPSLATGRQLPGLLNDEIRGVTAIPLRVVAGPDPSPVVKRLTGPVVQRTADNVLTNGLTGQLGMADGLLVGNSYLAPEAKATMAAVLTTAVADRVADPVRTFQDLQAAADRRPC